VDEQRTISDFFMEHPCKINKITIDSCGITFNYHQYEEVIIEVSLPSSWIHSRNIEDQMIYDVSVATDIVKQIKRHTDCGRVSISQRYNKNAYDHTEKWQKGLPFDISFPDEAWEYMYDNVTFHKTTEEIGHIDAIMGKNNMEYINDNNTEVHREYHCKCGFIAETVEIMHDHCQEYHIENL